MFCEVQTFWIELVLFAVCGWEFCITFHGFVVSLEYQLTSYCPACSRVLYIHETRMLCDFIHPWSHRRQLGPQNGHPLRGWPKISGYLSGPGWKWEVRSEKWVKAWPDPIVCPGHMALSFGSRLSLVWHCLEDSSYKLLTSWVTHQLLRSLLWVGHFLRSIRWQVLWMLWYADLSGDQSWVRKSLVASKYVSL